jgi:outer membrane protein OmpA-like peptidoglycan-associated protein
MTRNEPARLASVGILSLIALALLSVNLSAQTVKIRGMIKARSGATIIAQTSDSPRVIVLLNDETQVGQIEGVLKVRRKEMSMAALIPGLEIQVEGSYDGHNQLVAKSIKFEGNDLERAQSIQAGLHETQEHAQQTRQELEKQNAELKAQAESLKHQQGQLTAQQEKIAANKAAINAAIARFGQLDDYYILDEVTVYFGNGKVAIDPPYKTKLLKLAGKAKTVEAFNIQVVGYASSAGSAALNQKLSEDRADSVTNLLVQDGNIPLTNMLAPGAMGETRQVGDDKTAEGQAQNRRVVVRVLQNKGIAGLHSLP